MYIYYYIFWLNSFIVGVSYSLECFLLMFNVIEIIKKIIKYVFIYINE